MALPVPLPRPEDEADPLAPADPLAMPASTAPAPLADVTPGQGAGGSVQVVAPPATTDTQFDKGAQENRTTTETTPAIDNALADTTGARKRISDANETIAKELEVQAQIKSDAADQKAAKEWEFAEKRRIKAEADQIAVDTAVTEERRRRADMDRVSNQHSFWSPENKGAPARVLGDVFAALADYAHIRAGGQGPSVASQYIEGEIAKDRQFKIDAFTRAKDFQQLAAHDIDHARDLLTDHLRQIDAEAEVQRNKLTAMLEAALSRSKVPMAAAEAQKMRAESDMKNAESEVKTRETFAAKVAREGARRDTTHVDNDKGAQAKPPSQGEADTGEYAAGIKEAVTSLQAMDPKVIASALKATRANENRLVAADNTSRKGIVESNLVEGVARGTIFAPNSKTQGLSDPEQSAAAASERWNSFVLHKLTGAAAAAGEKGDVATGFTLNPDDSPATMQEKMRGGLAMAERLKLLAGPAVAARLAPAQATTPAPKPPASQRERASRAGDVLKLRAEINRMKPGAERDRAEQLLERIKRGD